MVKKSAKSAKSKVTKKAAKGKVETNFVNELRSAARASAARRMKK